MDDSNSPKPVRNRISLPSNKNITTIIVIAGTILLAAIAIFTAIRLYQTRTGTITPNAPSSKPAAATVAPTVAPLSCNLNFSLVTPSPVPTPSPSPSPIPTPSPSPLPTPTPSPVPQCGSSCSFDSNCLSGQICSNGACRNPLCVNSVNCLCPTPSPTPSPSPSPTIAPTITPSPSPVPQCGSGCSFDSNCLTGFICSNGLCRNPLCVNSATCVCATATPSPSPTPTYVAVCTNVRAYDLNWNPLTPAQLAALTPGSQVYFTVFGTTTPGTFDKARFIINGVTQPEVTTQKPGSPGEFYMIYTIPTGVTTFTVTGQVHQAQLDQWF